ncbi:hypothetical protein GG344DRAFT_66416 [Lentinula edodes]|nr:hypothetical protein GG344DRAFT_66416 [Lentinula edodes]
MRFLAVLTSLSAVILLMAVNACNCPNSCGYKVDSSCKYHDSIGIEDVTISGTCQINAYQKLVCKGGSATKRKRMYTAPKSSNHERTATKRRKSKAKKTYCERNHSTRITRSHSAQQSVYPGNRLTNFPAEPQIPVPPKGRARTPYRPTIPPPDDDEDEPPPPVVHQQRHSEPLYHQIIPPPPPVDSTRQSAFDRPLWSPPGNRSPNPLVTHSIQKHTTAWTKSSSRTRGRKQTLSEIQRQDVARDRVRLGDVRLVPSSVLVERVNDMFLRHLPATLRGAEVNEIAMDGDIPPPPVLEEQTGGSPPFLVMLGPSAAPAVGPSQINVPFPVITVPRAPSADQQPLFPPESPERHVSFPLSTPSIAQQLLPHRHPSTQSPQISFRPTIATQIRLCVNLNHVYPLSAANTAYVRPDWGAIFLDEMEIVIEVKFRQQSQVWTTYFRWQFVWRFRDLRRQLDCQSGYRCWFGRRSEADAIIRPKRLFSSHLQERGMTKSTNLFCREVSSARFQVRRLDRTERRARLAALH